MRRRRNESRLPRIAVLSLVVLVALSGLIAVSGVGYAGDAGPQRPTEDPDEATNTTADRTSEYGCETGADGDAPDATGERAPNQSEAEVERVTPVDGNVTVTPGTELLFEAAATGYEGDAVVAEWTVDGELVASADALATEYGREGEALHRQAFAEAGTYDVTATVVDASGSRVGMAEWTVTVAENGSAAPEVAEANVDDAATLASDGADGSALAGNRTTNLSVELTDPDGDLHRVIWFLGVADARLDTSSVNGSADTANVSFEEACDACPVFVWVVDESGAVTEREVATVGASGTEGRETNGTATH